MNKVGEMDLPSFKTDTPAGIKTGIKKRTNMQSNGAGNPVAWKCSTW